VCVIFVTRPVSAPIHTVPNTFTEYEKRTVNVPIVVISSLASCRAGVLRRNFDAKRNRSVNAVNVNGHVVRRTSRFALGVSGRPVGNRDAGKRVLLKKMSNGRRNPEYDPRSRVNDYGRDRPLRDEKCERRPSFR